MRDLGGEKTNPGHDAHGTRVIAIWPWPCAMCGFIRMRMRGQARLGHKKIKLKHERKNAPWLWLLI